MYDPDKIKPLGPRLLVKMFPDEKETAGGIVIPEVAHETAVGKGQVMATGTGYWPKRSEKRVSIESLGIEKGDIVYFIKFLRETHTNQLLQRRIGDDMLIIEMKDVLYVEKKE